MAQPRKDAADLEVALHAHEVEPAQELRVVAPGVEPRGRARAPITAAPTLDALLRPGDVAVAQQRDEVVGQAAAHGVLEIEDAWVVARHRPSGCASDSRGARTPAVARARWRPAHPWPLPASSARCGTAAGRGAAAAASPETGSSRSAAASRRRAAAAAPARAARLDPHQRVERVAVERVRLARPARVPAGTSRCRGRSAAGSPSDSGPLEHARCIDADVAAASPRRAGTARRPLCRAARP